MAASMSIEAQTRPFRRRSWIYGSSFIIGLCCLIFSLGFRSHSDEADDPFIFHQSIARESKKVVYDLTFNPEIPNYERNRTQIGKENAAIFMLVRNEELRGALETIREVEDRFNRRYRYPWVFLNDKVFTEDFKIMTTGMASGKTEYGFISKDHWGLPADLDLERMKTAMDEMQDKKVLYGNSISYRHMCRFNSGFFFEHPLMLKYDYYWRVEPDVKYFCDQLYDPFTFMKNNNKKYGFTIAILEYPDTIPTLWQTAREFFELNPQYLPEDNALDFITDNVKLRPDDIVLDKDFEYNLCHFWSNFEIADLNFFRSEGYRAFFKHLDDARGFFYERWGDAPVHTIGAAALLNKSEIHHFSDIGYSHPPYHRCPKDDASYVTGRCLCPEMEGLDVDFEEFSCLPKWWKHAGKRYMFNQTDIRD